MRDSIPSSPRGDDLPRETAEFYRHVLQALKESSVPFLVGGAYAFNQYTGINRHTKDLDIFIRRQDFELTGEVLRAAGYGVELTYPHWLGKASSGDTFIDLIFSSGNGVAEVDDAWFEHAGEARVMDVNTAICPAEEMIWSKAFIMERERFDGADIMHLLRARGEQLDWQRLMRRFEQHWRILLSHLVVFGFIYPSHRDLVPAAVMDELVDRLRRESHTPPPKHDICLGTLLSREQYLNDIEQEGLRDARIEPLGNMSEKDTARWTEAIPDKREKQDKS